MRIASAQITFVNSDGTENVWSTSETDTDELVAAIHDFDREEALAEAYPNGEDY